MAEGDQLELRALAGGERPAFQPVAREADLLQLGGEDQQAALGLDEVVGEIGMDVERLVRGNRPRSRRPDDDPAFLRRELFQPEGTRYFPRLGKRKPDVDCRIDAV